MQTRKDKRIEHFLINVFVFVVIGLLSLAVFNFEIFNPITRSFEDITLTDIYYSKLIEKEKIYQGSITLINIEDKSRGAIAQMLEKVQQYHPRVVGLDIIFSPRQDSGNDSLSYMLNAYDNYVFSYVGKFDKNEKEIITDTNIVKQKDGYVNLVGENREHSTIRYFYPYYDGAAALSTAIIKKFDSSLIKRFNTGRNEPCEIKYFGGDSSFRRLNFEALQKGEFDSSEIKGGIVLFGYMGVESPGKNHDNLYRGIDEDQLFTPMNEQLSGRSYPDTHGVVIHANILRMMLDKEYIRVIPAWMVWILAFILCWALVPTFSAWYIKRIMWFHPFAKLLQLIISIILVYLSTLLYHKFNIKLESAILLASIFFLVDLILFYDAFIKLLVNRFKFRINSAFLGGHGHG